MEQGLEDVKTSRRQRRLKKRTAVQEEKSSEGWSHERIWHEIRPVSSERMKAPRGCENLKAKAVRLAGLTIMPLL